METNRIHRIDGDEPDTSNEKRWRRLGKETTWKGDEPDTSYKRNKIACFITF